MSNFDDLKKEIHEDAKHDPDNFFILDEGADFIEYEDETVCGRLCRYEDMSKIDPKEWIQKHIRLGSSVTDLDIDDIAGFVSENINKDMYRTLHYLVFIRDEEHDFDELVGKLESISGYPLLEVHDFPAGGQLGITWANDCCAIIHIGNIEKAVDQMIQEGLLGSWERRREIDIGIKSTIAHEIRHLAQGDIYLEGVEFLPDPEEDAEGFARETMDSYLAYTEPDINI